MSFEEQHGEKVEGQLEENTSRIKMVSFDVWSDASLSDKNESYKYWRV